MTIKIKPAMKKPILLLLLLFSILKTSVAQITIEKLLSAPFYSTITVSPTGSKVAWIKNERGIRNIQLADAPNYNVKNLTNFTDDDGQEITNLDWTSDALELYFVRGNAPQVRATASHNPAHLPDGTAPMIWKINSATGKLEKMGLGNNPTVSPNGERLGFLRNGQIFFKNLSDTLSPKQIFTVRGACSSLRWSPDGQKLAFVSSRTDHSFVGVYDFLKKDYTFFEPAIDNDASPSWSRDGKSLAFLHIQRNVDLVAFSMPHREGAPWSIKIADVATGKTRTVFMADAGSGSVYTPHNGHDQLMWSVSSDKIFFCWEKTGWQQLYAVATSGNSKPIQITNGAFEVDEVNAAKDNSSLIFNSNQNDIDRKHFWRVNTGGEKFQPEQLTSGNSIEALFHIAADSKTIFYIHTDTRTPTQVAVLSDGKTRILTKSELNTPPEQLVAPEALTLKASDGINFYNQVFYPKNFKNDKSHPALIFVHGGSRRQMLLGFHPSLYYSNAYNLSQYFAAQGYVVLNINYRSGIGYGRDFREALDFGATGASEFRDVEAAGEWLKANAGVDAKKIAIWGGSYGGYLTAHALARRSDLFSAGVDVHGVHNWNTSIPTFTPDYDSLRYPKMGELAYKSSPMNFIDGWKSPVLMIHGDDDANVNFGETMFLQRVLRTKNVETELLVIPDEVHSFLRFKSWLTAYTAIIDFFDRKIKKAK